MERQYSFLDELIMSADNAIRTLSGKSITTGRSYPAQNTEALPLSDSEKRHAAGLMRVNHAGEVSAQGLYQGQALTARCAEVKKQMQQSSIEENDHLDWCEKRLNELDSNVSILNPLWYFGSLFIGATAGLIGDKWSLGFVEETEYQVMDHLENHLEKIPAHDERSKKIIEQLKKDESHHANIAKQAGAEELPSLVKTLMGFMSKIMTKTAYWV